MSSYLNIYIVPKKDKTPIEIVSYSRADDIYAALPDFQSDIVYLLVNNFQN